MDSQWMTARQAAERWEVSLRYAQRLLAAGKVPGGRKYGRSWILPLNTPKPSISSQAPLSAKAPGVLRVSFLWDGLLPEQELDTAVLSLKNAAIRNQYLGEIAYMRGEFVQAKEFAAKAFTSDQPVCICASLFLLLVAISTNDFALYSRVEASLKELIESDADADVAVLAEAVLTTVAVGMFAPAMVPNWIREGDFSRLPQEAIPFGLYLQVKYLQNLAAYPQMAAVAQTTYNLCKGQSVMMDVYLLLMCGAACVGLDDKERARGYLLEALAIGMPHRYITPFVENVSTFNGLLEECVQQHYPEWYRPVLEQWKRTWKNWAVFHNRFAQDHVPLILNLREYRIATLAANRVPYARIAEQERLSVGRVRNIMQEIYCKLFVRNRDELAALVLWTPKTVTFS